MAVEPEPAFSSRLRRLRQAAGLSQEELAERAGLTTAAIGALERGERRHPYPHTLQALADALGLSPADRVALFTAVPKRGPRGEGGAAGEAAGQPIRWSEPPVPLTPLVGRDRDVAIVTGLLQHGSARLVTLTGPGGVGKTRLAVEVAGLLRGGFETGPVWVDLAPVRDPDLVRSSLARALGLAERAGQSLTEALENYLARRQALLVVDNFEHLLAAAPGVSALLERCPRLAVLVTSREALRLRGEHEVQVLPLGLPDPGAVASAESVARSEAVELFLQRVRAIRPGFALTDEDAPCIAAICARLDGVPLALELAAGQLKYTSPTALLARLEGRLALLEGGPRDLPARQRSFRATVAWSHNLLSAPEQDLFRRLAVFVGGFTLEAAAAVCGFGEPPGEVARALAALVDKSVVQTLPGLDGEIRFTMLETIRDYARERLAASAEEGLLASRHAGYFCGLAETAEPHLTSASRDPWLRRLEVEVANLRAALVWSVTLGDPSTGLRLAGALAWFWMLCGYIGEGTHWANLLLALPATPGGERARAGALYAAGAMAFKREDHAAARGYGGEAVELLRALGDWQRLAIALAGIGLVATAQGDLERAIEYHRESLALFREKNDHWGIAYALANLGDPLFQRGDLAGAHRHYSESLERFERLGDPWGRAINHHTLGNVAWVRGDIAAARAHYGAAVALTRSIRNDDTARGLAGLAAATLREGDPDEAQRLLIESVAIWRDFGSLAGIALCLAGLASVQVAQGRCAEAARLFGAADAQGRGRPPLYVMDAGVFSPYLEAAREHLGEAVFLREWAGGQEMTLEQALERSLQGGAAT